MKLTVFGLSITSAWGNGHATLLRGLFRALHSLGHKIDFFERNTPYYAAHRDASWLPYVNVYLYDSWPQCLSAASCSLAAADVAMVTSYCADGNEASLLIQDHNHLRSVFYDMDTPVTLSELDRGNTPAYLPSGGLASFDLVLSYTGSAALEQLKSRLGARRVEPMYGWVDPEVHAPAKIAPQYECDLSYIGTYSADRQAALDMLLIEPARHCDNKQFIIAGAMHQDRDIWPANIKYFDHLPPPEHSSFYSSSRLTLNVTRGAMARMGYCPSGRLFEAAACATPVVSDLWPGLESFFTPGQEILTAQSSAEIESLLRADHATLKSIGKRARQRALDCHTAEVRAKRFLQLIETIDSDSEELSSDLCEGVR